MNRRRIAVFSWIVAGLFLVACVATQVPLRLPSVRVPSVPSVPQITVPTVSAPGIALPTLAVPTVNAPSIGLTLVNGVVGTPMPTSSTAIPAVPVTGSSVAGEILKWVIYALLLVAGIVLVIAMFARTMRHTRGPDEPPDDRPDI